MTEEIDIFSKIRDGLVEANIVYKNKYVTAFKDINPVTPVHILIIPNIKIVTANDVCKDHIEYLGNMILAASDIAKKYNIDETGYRIIINCGRHGGQEIQRVKMHFLSPHRM